jgi:hypothetical protein
MKLKTITSKVKSLLKTNTPKAGIGVQLPWLQEPYAYNNLNVSLPTTYVNGVAPNEVILSNDHNALGQYTTETIVELQQAGKLFYNSNVAYPQGALVAMLDGTTVIHYQAKQAVPEGIDPTNSGYWQVDPAGNALPITGGTMTGALNLSNQLNGATGGTGYWNCVTASNSFGILGDVGGTTIQGTIKYNLTYGIGIYGNNSTANIGLYPNNGGAGLVVLPDGTAFVGTTNNPQTNPNNRILTMGNNTGSSIPIGAVMMWFGTSAPAGWAINDGGTYNGVATVDMRGYFPRGLGGVDPTTGRALGSVQLDAMQVFGGTFNTLISGSSYPGGSGALNGNEIAPNAGGNGTVYPRISLNVGNVYSGGPRTASENRSINKAVNFITYVGGTMSFAKIQEERWAQEELIKQELIKSNVDISKMYDLTLENLQNVQRNLK